MDSKEQLQPRNTKEAGYSTKPSSKHFPKLGRACYTFD